MHDEIARYELDVLRWHREQPRQESGEADRRDAQHWLAMAGYLTLGDKGRFSITTKGLRFLASCK
jgi:hypothetical protein